MEVECVGGEATEEAGSNLEEGGWPELGVAAARERQVVEREAWSYNGQLATPGTCSTSFTRELGENATLGPSPDLY